MKPLRLFVILLILPSSAGRCLVHVSYSCTGECLQIALLESTFGSASWQCLNYFIFEMFLLLEAFYTFTAGTKIPLQPPNVLPVNYLGDRMSETNGASLAFVVTSVIVATQRNQKLPIPRVNCHIQVFNIPTFKKVFDEHNFVGKDPNCCGDFVIDTAQPRPHIQ